MAKAGKNENTAVKPSKVVIRNWDEWFSRRPSWRIKQSIRSDFSIMNLRFLLGC